MSKATIKTATASDYRKRLNRVVDHLFRHLDENIRIDDLAEVPICFLTTGTVFTQPCRAKQWLLL